MIVPETEIIITKGARELTRITVKPGDYVIGRAETADIVVPVEDVSERHALLTVNYHELFIEDLSNGGTSVGGSAVTGCTRIWPNQHVRIGSAALQTRRIRAPSDTDLSLAPETEMLRQLLPAEFLRERKYEIGGLVARGEVGDVVDALEATTGRTVAMKVMLSSLSEEEILGFIGEAQITSQLEHPNIIPVHDLDVDEEDHVFYTTKLVQGVTLRGILKKIAAGDAETIANYPLAQLLTIFQKICDGIAFAHSRSVSHGDLRSANVTIGEYGEALVMNWGHAKFFRAPDSEGSGTAEDPTDADGADPGPASVEGGKDEPLEKVRAETETVDVQEDISALGAILYHMLSLRPPAEDGPVEPLDVRTESGIRFRIGSQPAEVGGPHLPDGRIPASLAAVAMKALSASPPFSYANVPELQADITAYQNGFPTSAERASLLNQLVLLVGRHRREAKALAASMVALLILGLVAYVYTAWERNVALREGHRVDEQRIAADFQRMEAASERARAESERARAERTLSDLRAAAPAYQQQARVLIQTQKYDEALEALGFAIALVPENPIYHLEKANTLQSMQRLSEAAESYRKVLARAPAYDAAKTNLAICEQLLSTAAGGPLTSSQQGELLDAIVAQKRSADGVFLASALGREADTRLAEIKGKLGSITQQPKWNDARLRRRDGKIELDLSDLTITDLSMLRDFPINALSIARIGVSDLDVLSTLPLVSLDCSENPISDLSPLQGRPLKQLAASSTRVSDLTPLKGMSLTALSLRHGAVTDLSPLRGMPIETLSLTGLPISSIEPLRGMPLRRLDLFGCRSVTDFAPLATLARLEMLNLPAHFTDLALVQKLRSLQRVGSGDFGAGAAGFDRMPSVAAYIGAYGQRLTLQNRLAPRLEQLRQILRQLRAPETTVASVALGGDGFMDLDLAALPLDNLSALSGLPIRRLVIKGTRITDLAPLRGMPLAVLDASDTRVADLAPLASCPSLSVLNVSRTAVTDLRALAALKLNHLALSNTGVRDLGPLAGMPLRILYFDGTQVESILPLSRSTMIESMTVSRTAQDLSLLRRFPRLLRISIGWDSENNQPAESAADFWANYDATAGTRGGDSKLNSALVKLRQLSGWKDERCEKQADGTYKLDLSEVKVENLLLLADLPISILNISNSGVTRVGPIVTCPIREFYSVGCTITDLAVLSRLPLERVELTQDGPSDLRHLRGLKLRRLILHMKPGLPINPDLGSLKGMPLEEFAAYGFSELSNIRALEGAPLKDLRIYATSVSDLKPLRKMPLERLDVGASRVTDLSPLRECPLTRIDLIRSDVRDVSLLASCKTLESIVLPREAKGIEKLRALTNLKRISFEWTSDSDNTPAQTAEQFWAEFDKR